MAAGSSPAAPTRLKKRGVAAANELRECGVMVAQKRPKDAGSTPATLATKEEYLDILEIPLHTDQAERMMPV